MPLPLGEVSPKVTERALSLPCGELPPQRLRGLEMAEHKKALSEAASFFVWSPSSLGLKGASSPFLVGPARRNRWHFSGSLLVPKENNPRPAAARRNRRALAALNTRHLLRKPVCSLKAPLGLSCPPGTAVLSGSLLCGKREPSPPGYSASKSLRPCRAEHAAFASQTGLRLKSPTGAFMPSGHRRPFWFSFGAKREQSPPGETLSHHPETFIYLLFFRFHCSRRIHARMLR